MGGGRVHPQTVVEGFRIGKTAAMKALEGAAQDHRWVDENESTAARPSSSCSKAIRRSIHKLFPFYSAPVCPSASLHHSSDPDSFRKDLFNIARTTLSSKVLAQDKEYFANLAVDAVLRLKVSGSTNFSAFPGSHKAVYGHLAWL